MSLKHDSQGFLLGEPLDIGKTLSVLSSIRSDVASIRRSILSATREQVKSSETRINPVSAVPVAIPERTEPSVTHETPRRDPVSTPSGRAGANDSDPKLEKPATPPNTKRDTRGRFAGKGRNNENPDHTQPENPKHTDESGLKAALGNLTSAVINSTDGMEQVDPAVAAFQEVAQPLSRGYEAIFGGNKEDRWYRRIWGELKSFKNGALNLSQKANKWLKGIKDKETDPVAEGGGIWSSLIGFLIPLFSSGLTGVFAGLLSLLGTGLTKIFASLAKFLPFGAGMGRDLAGGAAAGGASGLPKKGGGFMAKAGRALKRVPLLGSLLTLGLGAGALYESENDDKASRRDKDKRGGGIIGGIGGALAGGAAGAAAGGALGAALGSIVPGLGNVIGGVLGTAIGGVAGMFLGEEAGEIIGSKVGEWVNDLRNSDIANQAIAAFDLMKADFFTAVTFFENMWADAKISFTETLKNMSDAWDAAKNWVKDGINGLIETGSGYVKAANEAIKNTIGIDVAETAKNAAESVSEAIDDVKKSVSDIKDSASGWIKDRWNSAKNNVGRATEAVGRAGSYVADVTKSAAGSAWRGTKEFASSMVPQGLKNSIVAHRAMKTGADYKQGNIAGLDDSHTRALVASTAATESAGGKLDVVNSAGYMGRYQAGAGWLADAGLIRGGSSAVKAAMKADGFTNEYKWGLSGGMSKFLKNTDNWNDGMSYDKYLSSAEMQDAAFKTNSDKSYASMLKRGVIKEGMSQDEIAGILKARHIAGEGGAAQAAMGMSGPADANGTTALKYKNDLVAGNFYVKAFSSADAATPMAPDVPVVASIPPPPPSLPSSPHPQSLAPRDIPPVPVGSMGGSKAQQHVIVQNDDVGQDLSDRGIAHIVTGGLS